jgi:hypothetical protein
MTPYARIVLVLVVALAAGVPATAAQYRYWEGDTMSVPSSMPEGMPALLNHDARIMGVVWFVDYYQAYCAGDTETLNAFLADFGALEDTALEVVLCVWPRSASTENRNDSIEPPQKRRVDWWLTISINRRTIRGDAEQFRGHDWLAELHIQLDAGIRLDELTVPAHLPVRSAGELERFIAEHEARREPFSEEPQPVKDPHGE